MKKIPKKPKFQVKLVGIPSRADTVTVTAKDRCAGARSFVFYDPATSYPVPIGSTSLETARNLAEVSRLYGFPQEITYHARKEGKTKRGHKFPMRRIKP